MDMDIHLWKRDLYPVLVKCNFDMLFQIIFHIPVMFRQAPRLKIHVHRAFSMICYTNERLRIASGCKRIVITYLPHDLLGMLDVIIVSDSECAIHASLLLLTVIHQDRSIDDPVGDGYGLVVIGFQRLSETNQYDAPCLTHLLYRSDHPC